MLTEFIRRTNADEPTPDVLGSVTDVSENTYIVSWFKTVDLSTYHESVHDDQIETFDFLNQQFVPTHVDIQHRVQPNSENDNEFILTGDRGDIVMKCPQNFKYNHQQLKCSPIPPCEEKLPGRYPIDERLLDILVLNHHVDKNYSNGNRKTHPTLYLRCLADGSHAVEECPDNYTFDSTTRECRVNELCQNRPDGYVLAYFPGNLLVNQFMQCLNGQHVTATCSQANQIFDRNLMECIDAHPCALNGTGHTYITADIGSTQFYKCLSNSESVLITCINRIRDANNQYQCSGDSRCAGFSNGTGQQIHQYIDDNVEYTTGQLVCDEFEIISEINCDQSNVFEDKLFLDKFKIDLAFPREVFNGTDCVDANVSNVKFLKEFLAIKNEPNHYNIDMQTSMIAMIDMIGELLPLGKPDEDSIFARWLLYARQMNAIGINPFSGEPIDCFGNNLYDVFDASRANLCDDDGISVLKTLHFSNGDFLNVLSDTLTGIDYDYEQFCAISYENREKIVKNKNFVARILTNILHTDICTDLYTTIYQKYTTLARKYTTMDPKYNYTFVKRPKNIIVYGVNTRLKNATISENAHAAELVFDPFQKSMNFDQVSPVFNPFEKYKEYDSSREHGAVDSEHDEVTSETDEEVSPPTPPSPLILENKDLFYACHYEVPLFKLTSCHAENNIIINALAHLRKHVEYDTDCQSAKGLANVLNAYAYLGDNIGCRSIYTNDVIKVMRENEPSHVYSNLQTQSNDGVKYNRWLHVKDNEYLACPEDMYDDASFTCNVEPDKLYYIENMQE